MKTIPLVIAISCALGFHAQSNAQSFLQKLQKKIESAAQPGAGQQAASAGESSGRGGTNVVGGQFCQQFFGKPFKQKQLAGQPSAIVGKYFKITPETDKTLADGINVTHAGSLVSFSVHLVDIKDNVVRALADAYLANPSIPMLAQVIAYAEGGDGYAPENGPSELTEAQTLLAMLMMQYPQLTLNRGNVNQMLRQAEMNKSGLARTFVARHYLFGDYAEKNINTFSNYIGQAQSSYPVKLADRTIFYALEKIPNWQYRQQYLDLLRQSQDMQQKLQNQQQAARSSNLNARAIQLMREGNRADLLTLEALGAGPKIAEIKAKGEMLRKEAAGESNLIKVEVGASDDAKAEILKMMAAAPVLDEASKAKLAESNRIKAANVNDLYAMSGELMLKMANGDLGSVIETGQYLNHYSRNVCQVINRQVEVAKQSGIPEPQMDKSKLGQSLL
jgi:hypothetical protein